MSQPKRFEVQLQEMGASIFPHYAGRFVEYSDYAALAAENERLKAEVEWLRKADKLVCWNPKTEQWEIRHEAVQ